MTALSNERPPNESSSSDEHGPVSSNRRLTLIVLAIVALPFVVDMVTLLFRPWHPVGELALITARTHDVFGGDTPLVGAYSQWAFNHPGPWENYLLALPLAMFGGDDRGLLAGTLAINGACAVGAVALLRRFGGRLAMVLGAVATLLVCRSLGSSFLMDPWNASALVFPVLLFVVSVWAITCGGRWVIPLAVATGSLAVQMHVGVTGLVVGLGVIAFVAWLLERRARDRAPLASRSKRWGPAISSAALVLVFWLPVVWQQVSGPDGNLSKLWDFFRQHQGIGWEHGLGVASRELSPVGAWLTGREPSSVFAVMVPGAPVWVVVFFVAIGGSLWLRVARYGFDAVGRFGVVILCASGLAVYSIAQSGQQLAYLIRWTWILALLGWLFVVWSALDPFLTPSRRPDRSVRAHAIMAAVAIASIVAVVCSVGAVAGRPPREVWGDAVNRLRPALLDAVPEGTPIAFEHGVPHDIDIEPGFQWMFERAGRPAEFAATENRWGPLRESRRQTPQTANLLVVSGERARSASLPGGYERIAFIDDTTPDERDEHVRIGQEIAAKGSPEVDLYLNKPRPPDDQLVDPALVDRWRELNERVVVGVFRKASTG